MYEDSLSFAFLGGSVFAYGLCIALGAALAIACFALLCRRERFPAGTAVLFGVLALLLGVICARLLFSALDFRFHTFFTVKAMFTFWGGGLSMVGALLGAALAGVITAKLQRLPVLKLLDLLAPALLVFIGFARIGEQFTELLGRSRTLVSEVFANSFLAQSDEYSAVLKTYLLEAVTAFLLAAVMLGFLCKSRRAGDTLLVTMLLFGTAQVLFESLRFDSHMRQSFISFQQILYACMFAVPLFKYALDCKKKLHCKKSLPIAVIVLVALTGAVVGLEFMIDRSGVSRILLYAVYALLLCVPAALGLIFRKRSM